MNRTIALLALLAAFPPLSTDMYLPAIPTLREIWQQPLVVVNLTLVAFFATYCVFLLLYGPISDRFGRRRPLMAGISIYIVSSLLCAVSPDVITMIVARVFQAAGGASASAISLAICKDIYDGPQREKIFAYIAVIVALSPMLSPMIGAWLLTCLSWPWIFITQAAMGAIALVGVCRMPEPLKQPVRGRLREMLGCYVRLARNRRFMGLNLAMSLVGFPAFAFIAGSSDIYISRFGLSEKTFGYFFGFNAFALMCGSFLFPRIRKYLSSDRLLTLAFAGVFGTGIWLAFDWLNGPWRLALPMWLMSFCFAISRPMSNNLILEQVEQDVGAASSMLMFTYMMIGAVAMWTISLDWSDKIAILGFMGLIVGGINLIFWLMLQRVFVPAVQHNC